MSAHHWLKHLTSTLMTLAAAFSFLLSPFLLYFLAISKANVSVLILASASNSNMTN